LYGSSIEVGIVENAKSEEERREKQRQKDEKVVH
jgi:hypothetical protein